MHAEEEIKQLQQQVQELSEQLLQNSEKIKALEETIAQLKTAVGNSFSASVTPAVQQPVTVDHRLHLENFIGLRLIHLVGIVILVIGLSIGVKYAIDKNLISEGARILLAYAAGIVLYLLSWRLKKQYTVFSSILFSGGMASLYFTTYAAFVYYNMFSPAVAFIIMVALTVFTVYNAISYNKQEIAILGLVGAYAIPFLISANAGRMDLFFGYISIINIAVVYLALKKDWKLVGRLALLITWILFLGWSVTRYKPPQQWMGTVFMSFFFILFAIDGLTDAVWKKQPLSVHDGQQLIINNVAFYVGTLFIFNRLLVRSDTGTISLFFSFLLAAQTLLLHYLLPHEGYAKKLHGLLTVILLVLFVGFTWKGISVTLLWLMLAVALFVAGLWLKTGTVRMWAILLMGVTLLKLVVVDSLRFTTVQKIIAYLTLGILLLVVSFFYQKFKEKLFGDGE